MVNLNYNYDEIGRQLQQLRKRLDCCVLPFHYYELISNMMVLADLYHLSKNELFDGDLGIKNDMAIWSKYNQRRKNRIKHDFLKNRDYHNAVFMANFFPASEYYAEQALIFNRNEENSYFDSIEASEIRNILYSFFEEEFSEGKEILEELVKNNRIFGYSGEVYDTVSSRGFMYFNSILGLGNVFLRDDVNSIAALSTLVHELGHVYDFLTLECSTKDRIFYSKGYFSEVMSSYYQQRLINFLIDNNIHKDEAITEEIENLSGLFFNLDSSLLLSLLSDCDYSLVIDEECTKEQLIGMVEESYADEFTFEGSFDECSISGFKELGYSYGILIAEMISDGLIKRDDFLKIRNKKFSPKSLEGIGFDPDSSQKVLTKRIERAFK